MKTFLVCNEKGGCAKTTTAVSLAYILSRNGKKVLLVDIDKQGNASDTLRTKVDDVATIYDVLLEDLNKDILTAAIQETDYENLYIISSDPLLVEAEPKLSSDTNGLYKLMDLKELVEDDYDYMIIDSAPTVNMLLKCGLAATDGVIIPAMLDRYNMKGISSIEKEVESIKKRINKGIQISGILITQYNERTKLTQKIMTQILAYSEKIGTKVYDNKIRVCNKVKEAQTVQMPLIAYSANCTASMDYESWVEEMDNKGDL
ncbi:MAG: ParA family protein [Lachnospiraceae bacterium]|nr:ParA family protein [Lachnospiraceae bacterium]